MRPPFLHRENIWLKAYTTVSPTHHGNCGERAPISSRLRGRKKRMEGLMESMDEGEVEREKKGEGYDDGVPPRFTALVSARSLSRVQWKRSRTHSSSKDLKLMIAHQSTYRA